MNVFRPDELIGQINTELKLAADRRAKIDPRLAGHHRQQEERKINEEAARRVAKLRTQVLAGLQEMRDSADRLLVKAQLAQDPQGTEWAEANARAPFVAQDVAAMTPAGIVQTYKALVANGDQLGAWLVARAGLARLGKERTPTMHDQIGTPGFKAVAAAGLAYDELDRAAHGAMWDEDAARRRELAGLEVRLTEAVTAAKHEVGEAPYQPAPPGGER